MRVREKLGLEDAFEGYVVEQSRIDMQGWNSSHPLIGVAIEIAKPKLVIELGVWKGMSTIEMARLMKLQGLKGEILCIDTWLGSSGHLSQAGRRGELHPKNGYPTVYQTFLANVASAGHADVVTPLAMDGTSAAYALKRLKLEADVIHIDASHEYEAVLADLRNYWPLLSSSGILIADDYGVWPGVTRAVCAFASEVDRPVFASMAKALVPKDPNLALEMQYVRTKRYRRSEYNTA
jgi:predicted O-methyltransferase YrrM